jgi:predicted RNA-binding Zn ribbon-like protein
MPTVKSRPSQNLPEVIAVPRRDLAVEFVNTLAWRGSSPTESLHDFGDVITWLAANKAMQVSASTHLHRWFAAHPARAAEISRAAIELRETIHRLLKSAASSSVPAREDLRDLNLALGDAAPRVSLERTEGGFGWRIEAKTTAAGVLAPVLWSAADILVGPDSARVRECANDRCLWLFLDDSKNGSRRWCSMQACGNRAKAHRHYLRQKGE